MMKNEKMEDQEKRLAEEFEKIDWDKNDVTIRGIESWGPHERNDGGFLVKWSKPHVGFGELSFFIKDGKLHCNTECMGRKFVKQVLKKVAETVELNE